MNACHDASKLELWWGAAYEEGGGAAEARPSQTSEKAQLHCGPSSSCAKTPEPT